MLATDPSAPEYPDMLVQMAGFYLMYRHYDFAQVDIQRQQAAAARAAGDQAGWEKATKLADDHGARIGYMTIHALGIYRTIVDDESFRDYPRRAEVLVMLINELEDISSVEKFEEEAKRRRAQLQLEYPTVEPPPAPSEPSR